MEMTDTNISNKKEKENEILPMNDENENDHTDPKKQLKETMTTINGTTTTFMENLDSAFFSVVNQTSLIMLVLFLVVYFILSSILANYYKDDTNPVNSQLALSRSIDFVLLLIVGILFLSYYLNLEDKHQVITDLLVWTRDFYNDDSTPFTLAISLFFFYLLIFLLQIPMTEATKPFTIGFLESKFWILLLTVIIVDFFKYVLHVSIIDMIFGRNNELITAWESLYKKPVPVAVVKPAVVDISKNKPVATPDKEVFNISNNLYSYEEAQQICKAYDARLATYDEIEDAYNNGAEWNSYGWSEDQMILFPTQKKTWDKLQQTKDHKRDLGHPGVNGGYIDNPYLRFGVNCHGLRPKMSDEDKLRMNAQKDVVFPKSAEDLATEAKVKYWKDNASKLLIVNSFNKDRWSEY
jgi:hypothetical protein